MKEAALGLVALAVAVVPPHIPHGVTPVGRVPQIVGDVRNDELGLLNGIRFPILKTVVIQFILHRVSSVLIISLYRITFGSNITFTVPMLPFLCFATLMLMYTLPASCMA